MYVANGTSKMTVSKLTVILEVPHVFYVHLNMGPSYYLFAPARQTQSCIRWNLTDIQARTIIKYPKYAY
jgi:hypothetical protein